MDASLLETDGRIVGIGLTGCVLFPPGTFLVAPRDARPPIDPEPRSGNSVVDAAINAFETHDRSAIRNSLDFTTIGYIATPQGIGSPPLCRPNEVPGTPLAVLSFLSCEGSYGRADELDPFLDIVTAPDVEWQLYAVIDLGPPPDPKRFFEGNIVAVIEPVHPDRMHGSMALVFTDRGIRSIWSGCGPELSVRQLSRFGQFASKHDYLLAPPSR